ncbi:immunity protein Tsi6 family protein [Nitrospirillum viridazoti]|uniref:Tsi6 domain-containing protein n=1 Tax=Nitrospirillum viridazoti CBAmc TaxID=1441467 RepID=A0A248JNA0_9PROT|nr:immunity protein Tsi6 family protein [Nitrospirillum amazonense]ASG19548.1 hypothetical protein Y958_00935 [Nitrospirillum amazonense CBAmc]
MRKPPPFFEGRSVALGIGGNRGDAISLQSGGVTALREIVAVQSMAPAMMVSTTPISEPTSIQVSERALALAEARLAAAPEFSTYASLVAQLRYVLMALKGGERARLKEIIVGHYAVREFAESDPELAEALMAAQAIATRMGRGLKP